MEDRCRKCAERSIGRLPISPYSKDGARNYALYRKLAKAVDHDGTTIVTEKTDGTVRRELNPDAKLLIQIQTVLLACERELGFTPSSRARVNIATKDEPVNEFDGF